MKTSYQSLCYVSSAKRALSDIDFKHLTKVNRRNNIELGIFSLLMYNNGNFLQILEGEKSKLDILFSKISNDKRHHNIIQLWNIPCSYLIFAEYNSQFIATDNTDKILQLKNYLTWLKNSDLASVNTIIGVIEKFVGKKLI